MTTDKLWMKFVNEVIRQYNVEMDAALKDKFRLSGKSSLSEYEILSAIDAARTLLTDKIEEGFFE